MYLIDEEDDLTGSGDHFVYDSFESLFELALVLRTCDECSHIEGVYLFLFQVLRHVATHDTMRESLGNSCLTDTRFTDKDRVVLRTTAEDL